MTKQLILHTTRTEVVHEEYVLTVPDDFDSDAYADLTFEQLAQAFPVESATTTTVRYEPLGGIPEGVTRDITYSTVKDAD